MLYVQNLFGISYLLTVEAAVESCVNDTQEAFCMKKKIIWFVYDRILFWSTEYVAQMQKNKGVRLKFSWFFNNEQIR